MSYFQSSFFSFKKNCGRVILLSCLFISALVEGVNGQKFSLSELLVMTEHPDKKFDACLRKNNFVFSSSNILNDTIIRHYCLRKDSTKSRILSKHNFRKTIVISYQTTSLQESENIQQQIQRAGFHFPEELKNNSSILYQKHNVLIYLFKEQKDSNITYSFRVEKRELLKSKDFIYAEDLLKLDSHEFLATVFGESNVKKDIFYFPDGRANKCSVIFPNTKWEVVFIWDDQPNYRKIASVRIGGNPTTEGSVFYDNPIEQNAWVCKEGIYSGASLSELERANGDYIFFTEGDVKHTIKFKSPNGKINFNNKSFLFGCLNCEDGIQFIAEMNNLLSRDNRKIYISTVILYP